MRTLVLLIIFLSSPIRPLYASTDLIEGVILRVDKGGVTVLGVDHYHRGSAVEERSKRFEADDVYVLDNHIVPRDMALKPGRKIYIWGKGGGSFYAVVSEASACWSGTVQTVADGSVTLAVPLGEQTIERHIELGDTAAPAEGDMVTVRPARAHTIEALTPAAHAAALPRGPVPETAEGWIAAGDLDSGSIPIIDLTGAQRSLAIDRRIDRGLLFHGAPGEDISRQLPVGTRVAWFSRQKGWKDMFLAAVLPDPGRLEGTIAAVDGQKVTLAVTWPERGEQVIEIGDDAVIRVDGTPTAASDLLPDMAVLVYRPRPTTFGP